MREGKSSQEGRWFPSRQNRAQWEITRKQVARERRQKHERFSQGEEHVVADGLAHRSGSIPTPDVPTPLSKEISSKSDNNVRFVYHIVSRMKQPRVQFPLKFEAAPQSFFNVKTEEEFIGFVNQLKEQINELSDADLSKLEETLQSALQHFGTDRKTEKTVTPLERSLASLHLILINARRNRRT